MTQAMLLTIDDECIVSAYNVEIVEHNLAEITSGPQVPVKSETVSHAIALLAWQKDWSINKRGGV